LPAVTASLGSASRPSSGRTIRAAPSDKGERFALRVDVRRGDNARHTTLLGQTQADAAAAGAAGVARALIEGEISKPGAWMPEQVIDPASFLSRLAAHGLKVEWSPA